MKKDLLLIMMLCLCFVLSACNGAGIDGPTSNQLPGKGTDDPSLDDKVQGNYAIDILPQREIPPSIPIIDPEWEPMFDSLTSSPICIPEGCMDFELENFDEESLQADFKVTFFNWNAENFNSLTVFLLVTETAYGVDIIEPDGDMPPDDKSLIEYPYFAFNNDNNPGDNDVPGTMYCYFEREISFQLSWGCEFDVNLLLVPIIDQHDLSYKIDPPGPVVDPGAEGGEGREGGANGGFGTVPADGETPDDEDGQGGADIPNGNTIPNIKKPGN